jgi:hypothetical protein
MPEHNYPQTDHDLLIRIDQRVLQIAVSIEDHEKEIKKIGDDVDSLRTSRAQFYAIAATLSTVIGVLIKVFWK